MTTVLLFYSTAPFNLHEPLSQAEYQRNASANLTIFDAGKGSLRESSYLPCQLVLAESG